ncbi:sigma factor binding protein 1 [Striga asiatica]|uniref:Sigma factor binding protein 1 n=1 Tax=Striga asiatica TaxID=4170 RepID=A0A5A7PWR2_STRAF|nr:sigma factor binding protein 1 [Striga asiatica]
MNFDQNFQGLVQNKNPHKAKKRKSSTTTNNNSLKVVYISSPMKVKTSASRFRSLVQELTGKNSDISRYTGDESNFTAGGEFLETDHFFSGDLSQENEPSQGYEKLSSSSIDGTPTSSDSILGMPDMDGMFVSQMREQFEDIFSVDSFYDPTHMDVLGSFDELL